MQYIQTFWQKYRHLTVEDFVSRFKHPFLIEIGRGQLDPISASFENFEEKDEDEPITIRERLKGTTPPPEPAPRFFDVWHESHESEKYNPIIIPIRKRPQNSGEIVTVGRNRDSDIVLARDYISKKHARIIPQVVPVSYLIMDVGSTNGTYINQERVKPHTTHTIKDGDIVSFSISLEFYFRTPEGLYYHLQRTIGGLI